VSAPTDASKRLETDSPSVAMIPSESLGGIGPYLEDIEGFGVGTEANIVYSGQFMMAHVRHIEPQADVGYVVGVVCELIE